MDSHTVGAAFRSTDLQYLGFLDKLPVAVFIIDAAGKPYFANHQAQQLLGRGTNQQASADQLGEVYQAYVAGTNEPYPAERMPVVRALSGAVSYVDDMEVRHPDKTIQIEVWGSPVLGRNGEVEYAVAVFIDITERKRAEAELKLARELAAVIASAPTFEDALRTSVAKICEVTGWAMGQAWLPDGDGGSLRCSRVWYAGTDGLEDFRRANEEMVLPLGVGLPSRAWATRQATWDPDVTRDRAFVRGGLAARAGLVAGMAVPVLAGNDVVAVIEFFVFERRERDERFLNLVSTVAAQLGALMSEKQAEDALRASEAEFRAVAETASDAIISAGADGTITYFNTAATQMFGLPAYEALGKPLTVLIPERFQEAHRTGFERYLRTGEARVMGHPVEVAAQRMDGTEFPAELSLAGWKKHGEVFFTAIVRDVSERVRAERTVQQALGLEQEAVERLQALDGMKNTLLRAVSHDLRNPLAAIMTLTSMLDADAEGKRPLPADVRARLTANVATTARKMERLLTDLVDFDRLDTVEPDRRRTDLGGLVLRVLAEADLGNSHPVASDIKAVEASVDAAKVERIVDNLLSNAAKHVPAGVPIWVRVGAEEGGALISVEDAGPGVPVEMRERIFTPFSRGPEVTSSGLGIGLSLVSRFAELHGGRAWVEDRSGGGAAFRVFLPDAGSRGE